MSIHDCCRFGNLSEVRRLLDAGIDVNLKDYYGRTPLHIASLFGHIDIVKELLIRGADINPTTSRASWEGSNVSKDEWTPLLLAIECGRREVVRELIRHGADVNMKYTIGWTPLHFGSRWCELEMVQILLEYCDPSIKDNEGKTAIDVAVTDEIKQLIAEAIEDQKYPNIKEPDCY
jgi:ankyrin repeat protein